MRPAVSNIAWAPADAGVAYALLAQHGVAGLEIAPGLFLAGAADPWEPTRPELAAALDPVRGAGLTIVSMQSLLFGVEGAALFGDPDARTRLDWAMARAIALAERLAVPTLVFGSPRQRVNPGLDETEARAIAVASFQRFGDAAEAAGCRIAVETNPAAYGTNFLTRTAETIAFVAAVDHPAVALNLDLGAVLMNVESTALADMIAKAGAARIAHVHVSEPDLAPAPADTNAAGEMLGAVASAGYRGWCSIEMREAPIMPLAVLETCLMRLTAVVGGLGEC